MLGNSIFLEIKLLISAFSFVEETLRPLLVCCTQERKLSSKTKEIVLHAQEGLKTCRK